MTNQNQETVAPSAESINLVLKARLEQEVQRSTILEAALNEAQANIQKLKRALLDYSKSESSKLPAATPDK